MIRIYINPTAFNPGGPLAGHDPATTILHVGSGKPEQYAGVIKPVYGPGHPFYSSSSHCLPVTVVGVEIYDITLELYKSNSRLQAAFQQPILDLMQKGIIVVEEDGVALAAADVLAYTA